MTAQPRHAIMSVADYLQLDRASPDVRYEYFNGEVIMLAGGKTKHAKIGGNMYTLLDNALLSSSCIVYNSDTRVRVSEKQYVYPDVTVACDKPIEDEDFLDHPRVIIEVLSPSTEMADRSRKFSAYKACPSIEEYVLVSTDYRKVEIFRREKQNFWMYQEFVSEDEVYLKSLDIRFSVSALYRDVNVPDNEPDFEL
jgi:Uma2 family endonuclease